MSVRGRPSRSIALAATISAWVESSPPETPMTMRLHARRVEPLHQAGDLDVVGLVAVLREPRRVGRHEGEALDRAARSRYPPSGGSSRKAMRRKPAPLPRCGGGCRRRCPGARAPGAAGRGRHRPPRSGRPRGSARSRPAWRRSRRSRPGRPRRGRWWIRPRRRRRRHRPRGSAPIATGRAAAASPPCRW